MSLARGWGAITSSRSATVEPRRAGRHDEGREPARARRLAGAGEDDILGGDAAIGDPGLFAIEHEAASARFGGERDGAGIGARLRLGQGEGGERLAGGDLRQETGLLLVRAGQADRTAAEALHGKGEIGEPVMTAQGFTDDAEAAHIELCVRAAMRRHDRMFQEARLAQLAHQGAAGVVFVVRGGQQVDTGAGPVVDGSRQLAVAGFEKRPVEEALIRHLVALELRFTFGGEGLEGAGEIPGRHAHGLGLGLRLDRLVDAHVPFRVHHALGDAVGEARARG